MRHCVSDVWQFVNFQNFRLNNSRYFDTAYELLKRNSCNKNIMSTGDGKSWQKPVVDADLESRRSEPTPKGLFVQNYSELFEVVRSRNRSKSTRGC